MPDNSATELNTQLAEDKGQAGPKHLVGPAKVGQYLKDQIILLMGIFGSIPILTDYFVLSGLKENVGRWYTLLASFLSMVAFVLTYLVRDHISKWNKFLLVFLSLVSVAAGGLAIVEALNHVGSPIAMPIYLLSYPLLLEGVALPLVAIYEESMVRSGKLLNFAHALGEREWNALEGAGNALMNSKKQIATWRGKNTPLRDAFQHCHDHVLKSVSGTFSHLNAREIVSTGPAINELYKIFCDSISARFCAVSFNDLPFWLSQAGKGYLAQNRRLIDRNVLVERIFVLPEAKIASPDAVKILSEQAGMKIVVRVVRLEDYMRDFGNQDFGLFDDKVVSYFTNRGERTMILRFDPEQVGEYKKTFDEILELCVPGRQGAREWSAADLAPAGGP